MAADILLNVEKKDVTSRMIVEFELKILMNIKGSLMLMMYLYSKNKNNYSRSTVLVREIQ